MYVALILLGALNAHLTISSKDLIDIYIDGEQLPGSQFQLKILPGALPLRLPKLP